LGGHGRFVAKLAVEWRTLDIDVRAVLSGEVIVFHRLPLKGVLVDFSWSDVPKIVEIDNFLQRVKDAIVEKHGSTRNIAQSRRHEHAAVLRLLLHIRT